MVHGIGFFDRSYRLIRIISEEAYPYLVNNNNKMAIFAIFHGRMVGVLGLVNLRHKLTILVSQSRDGEMIARGVTGLGFTVARGSPSYKAVQGTRELLQAVKQGQSLAFMVDGPRGPIDKVKPGIIRLAQMANLPIIPFVCSARTCWWFPSWDKFMGPLWASPIVYVYGKPIVVPLELNEIEQENIRLELENQMKALKEKADQFWKIKLKK